MKRIPQHRKDGELSDLQSFIIDLEPFQRKVSHWVVHIHEYIGPGSEAFEELTKNSPRLSHTAFASMCYCINQTVDGIFEAKVSSKTVVCLDAVDSTYWEITSSSEFESYMVKKYGEFIG